MINSQASKLRNLNLTVFPCSQRKQPAFKGTWKTYTGPVETPIFGVAVPKGIVIIDLDFYKGVTQAQVEQALGCKLNWLDAEIQTTSQGGKHYAFRCDTAITQDSNLLGVIGFDTRVGGSGYICSGDGYHAYGSGVMRLSIPDTLPELPQIAVQRLLPRQKGHTIPPEKLLPQAPYDAEKTRSMLRHIPPNLGRSDWIRIGMACKAMGVPFEVFNDWSSGQYHGGQMPHNYDPLTIEFQYRSFKPEGEVRPATLRFFASQYGWKEDWSAVFSQGPTADPEALKRIAQEIVTSGSDITQIMSIIQDIKTAPLDTVSREAAISALRAELKIAKLWSKQLGLAIDDALNAGAPPKKERKTPKFSFENTSPAGRVVRELTTLPERVSVEQMPIMEISEYTDMQAINAMLLLTETFQSRLRLDGTKFRFWNGTHWEVVCEDALLGIVWAALGHSRCKSEKEASYAKAALYHVAPRFGISKVFALTIDFKDRKYGIPNESGLLQAYPHKPEYYNTTCLDVNYNPQAQMQLFPKFLEDLFGEYEDYHDRVNLLQEIMGYMLTNDTMNLQKAIAFEGTSRGGKGVLIEIMQAMLGDDGYGISSFSDMHKPKHQHSFVNKTIVFDSEAKAPERRHADAVVSFFNKMVSGERGAIEVLYKNEARQVRLRNKFLMACNQLPEIRDSSGSISNRFVVLKFSKSFYGREDRTLAQRLTHPTELEGIAQWALQGLQRLIANGGRFTEPTSSKEASDELRDVTQGYSAFIREEMVFAPNAKCHTRDVYEIYKRWALENGERVPALRYFSSDIRRELESRNVVKKKSVKLNSGVSPGFQGCALRSDISKVFLPK